MSIICLHTSQSLCLSQIKTSSAEIKQSQTNMKSVSLSIEKIHNHFSNPRFLHLTCLIITTLLCFHLLSYYRSTNIKNFSQINTNKDIETCNLFQGKWIQDTTGGPLYTNYSCKTIPFKRNCFLNGRNDTDFLDWRWKPDDCELRRFDPQRFLNVVKGKTMAFIGDSLAQNQMESLLCLLSTVETPKAIENPNSTKADNTQERFVSSTWEFPNHNFTLMALWSQFLVNATEEIVNGTATGGFHLHLDRVDTTWSEKLPSIDYTVFSDAHWFFRPNYLYEGGNLIGCVYCQGPNITDFGPGLAITRAFRAAFKAINECEDCRGIFTLLRTYSPPHFENGAWNSGGECNRRWPVGKEEVNRAGPDLDYRRIQVEEMEIARKEGGGRGNRFEMVDVTEMMLMRPDGHPGLYGGNRWMKGYSDCIHWCMPGPIDTWNELLLELITQNV